MVLRGPDSVVVKKWVVVVLALSLMLTFSMLVVISVQHYRVLAKVAAIQASGGSRRKPATAQSPVSPAFRGKVQNIQQQPSAVDICQSDFKVDILNSSLRDKFLLLCKDTSTGLPKK